MTALTLNYPIINITMTNIRWKAILGLALIWTAIYFNLTWIWGLIFLIWVVPEIKHGVAYFIENVERSKNPIVYWMIILSWILMSVYLIVTSISPKLNPESHEFIGYQSSNKMISMPTGEYKNTPIITDKIDSTKIEQTNNFVEKAISNTKEALQKKSNDTLKYQIHKTKSMYFVGISTQTTYANNKYESDLLELWTYFYDNDISYYVGKIVDERIFVIYSDYNKHHKDYFTVTIGYNTADTSNFQEGLSAIHMPPSNFAVQSSTNSSDDAVISMWENAFNSNLERKKDYDIEVYKMDKSYQNIENVELWISIK